MTGELLTTESNSGLVAHSQGPWTLDWTVAGGGVHEEFPSLHYVGIQSADFHTREDPLRITGYMRKADAYLLAAAPDMLAALKRAYSELLRYVDLQQKLDYIEYAAVTQKEIDVISVAIDKAEGKL